MRARAPGLAILLLVACDGSGVGPGDGGGRDALVGADAPGADAPESRDSGNDGRPPGDATRPDSGPPPDVVDTTTLDQKLLMGYQGWFSARGDGSRRDVFAHWSRDGEPPNASNLTFDAWPDVSDLEADELYPTGLSYADGSTASVFSAFEPRTVERHFRWMRETGIDGVFLQEFVVELTPGSAVREFRDRVTDNVRAGAEAHGRAFAIMYDISGADAATVVARIEEHWRFLVDSGHVGSDRYLRHRGRPLVAVWGFGFTDRVGTPDQVNELIGWFHSGAPAAYRATVMGGVPTHWRTLTGDSKTAPAWASAYRAFDVISPWTVGRYRTQDDVRTFARDLVTPDLSAARTAGADYLPVVWPGFSWENLMPGSGLNAIPRLGGRLWWTQLYEFTGAGATMIYGAMFDEVDEGTAMFKVAAHRSETPVTAPFLALDADGYELPSDFYLRLAGEGARVLRGERTAAPDRPIRGGTPTCAPPDSVPVEDRCLPSCGAAGGNSCDPGACAGRALLESHDCAVCCRI